ncbi:MAG TPA: hypothetical protein VL625_02780 [Patescibacteria group bacterium]|nr:hypothetical protein [Patescibacteria group bacterium]
MSDLQTENSKKPFNLAKLAEKAETDINSDGDGDNIRLKKFFRPTIFNLSDMQETSTAAS